MTHDSRLLTLVGPGGIGKTRLAIELARSLESAFPDGAWLVDLSALERGSEVWPAIAEALLIPPLPGVEWRIQVLDRLYDSRAILLMDNCEHVLDPIADAVTELGSTFGALFLINMELAWWEAAALFGLFAVQFLLSPVKPGPGILGTLASRIHWHVTIAYLAWAAIEILRLLAGRRKPAAFRLFAVMWRTHVR